MGIILWNAATQNVVLSAGGKAQVFVSSADADKTLELGLLDRLTEEAARAGLPLPVISQLAVS